MALFSTPLIVSHRRMADEIETGAHGAGAERPSLPAPSLAAIGWVFLSIGMQSFGGGMSAWIRREVVQRRGWMEDGQFVSGIALAQIAPGANGVNLAVFVGTTLRGVSGALVALIGMLLVPVVAVLVMATAFASLRDLPGVGSVMIGLGAAAIGLNIANGARLARRNIRGPVPILLVVVTAAAVGLTGLPLAAVLAVMLPISLLLAARA